MQSDEKWFRTVQFRFETDEGTHRVRYMIVDNYIPFFQGKLNRRAPNGPLSGVRERS